MKSFPRLTLFLLALFTVLPTLRAQSVDPDNPHDHIDFYLTFNAAHASNVDSGSPNPIIGLDFNPGPEQYTSFWRPGVGFGLTPRLVKFGTVSLGLDMRASNLGVFSFSNPTGAHKDVGYILGGLRVSYHPHHTPIRPYAQFSYGLFGTYAVNADPYVYTGTPCFCIITVSDYTLEPSTYSVASSGYEAFAGIDYPLTPHFDLRAVEFGYGKDTATQPLTVFNIDTGLLLHF